MSRYHGPQGKGAARRVREEKRHRAGYCRTGKVRYRNEHDARCALVSTVIARNRGIAQRQEQNVYECPTCQGGWHLTSQSRRAAANPPTEGAA